VCEERLFRPKLIIETIFVFYPKDNCFLKSYKLLTMTVRAWFIFGIYICTFLVSVASRCKCHPI